MHDTGSKQSPLCGHTRSRLNLTPPRMRTHLQQPAGFLIYHACAGAGAHMVGHAHMHGRQGERGGDVCVCGRHAGGMHTCMGVGCTWGCVHIHEHVGGACIALWVYVLWRERAHFQHAETERLAITAISSNIISTYPSFSNETSERKEPSSENTKDSSFQP